ncbi:hypothetical protein PCE1_001344 [Barthelona sp. PCE]
MADRYREEFNEDELINRLNGIKNNVHSISASAQVVAVSKRKPSVMIKTAYEAGQRLFGENYVQELVEKSQILPQDIEWHCIGPIQSNKVKSLVEVENLVIQTLHREKIARKFEKELAKHEKILRCFVQVSTSTEETKSGVQIGDALEQIVNVIETECPHLNMLGFMTIGQQNDLTVFESMRVIREEYEERLGRPLLLSMGMSSDFDHALRCGSNYVRIGSAIFGQRKY